MKRPLVLAAAALVVAACGDSPAEPVPTRTVAATAFRRSVDAATASKMKVIGGELVDATESFLVVVEDVETHTALSADIKSLADALIAGDAALSASALTTARERLAAISSDTAATELAPVALALDAVEEALQGAR
jgi:hypothetical protein